MDDKPCEKCGFWTRGRWMIDGMAVCSACLREHLMKEPKVMLDVLLSNVDIGVIAEWMDIEKVRDWLE